VKLTPKDSQVLSRWLRCNVSMSYVDGLCPYGLVENERFSEKAREKFEYLWMWSAHRFSGRAGLLQDAFHRRHGIAALERRFQRVANLIKALS
jgi:hypothetical protein